MQEPRILLLSSAANQHSIDLVDNFVAALNDRLGGVGAIEWYGYRDIRLEFGTSRIEAFVQTTGEPLDNFRFVYFKSLVGGYAEPAAAIATCLDAKKIPYVCSELHHTRSLTKLTQYARLASAGTPIADTVYIDPQYCSGQFTYLSTKLGLPFIFKATSGSRGRDNYLIRSEEEYQAALHEHEGVRFVAQRFIMNDSDLRVLVVGGQIQLIIRRKGNGDTHLNNTSQGGMAEIVPIGELSAEHRALSLQAAALMDREVAGVDLMFETGTGDPYILEVNDDPQIATGSFTDEKLEVYSNYFKNMLK